MFFSNAAAVLIGAVLGTSMGLIWNRIVPKDRGRDFYRQIGSVFHSMLTDANADFLVLYRTLIRETGRFLGTQFLGMLIALSPLIAILWVCGPAFHQWRNSQAKVISVRPAEDTGLLFNKEIAQSFKDGQVPITALLSGNAFGRNTLSKFDPAQDMRLNNAICPGSGLKCLLLSSLGFHVSFTDKAAFGGNSHPIIIRPWCGDSNPFWPYLSDPELYLWLGMGFFSVLVMFVLPDNNRKQHKQRERGPNISFMDYLLVTIATAIPGLFRCLGNMESRWLNKSLEAVKIDRPIFITGLARSGTTIVLELLSSMPSVATHKYRDFPFVMIPVLWQRFTAIFSSVSTAVERPHKDGIFITGESPEALEEPIWQYFFPHLGRKHVSEIINEEKGNPEFAKFFMDHVRKILLIRKGTRYLSKGNYNITRIKYLASLFPDARFVIPVRHPLEHVGSLVRQHVLFQKYAEEDDRVPNYLSSAGHYEFGPQRVPICLREGDDLRVLEAWRSGREHLGYAIQWANIYRFANELVSGEGILADRIFILRYEDLCSNPQEMLTRVIKFCEIDCSSVIATAASRIKSGGAWSKDLAPDICLEVWEEVRDVAELYGYQFPLSQPYGK